MHCVAMKMHCVSFESVLTQDTLCVYMDKCYMCLSVHVSSLCVYLEKAICVYSIQKLCVFLSMSFHYVSFWRKQYVSILYKSYMCPSTFTVCLFWENFVCLFHTKVFSLYVQFCQLCAQFIVINRTWSLFPKQLFFKYLPSCKNKNFIMKEIHLRPKSRFHS